MEGKKSITVKPVVVHITNGHCAFDDRIFYKELCSLAKMYNCYELTATNDGKKLTNMGGKFVDQGEYENVKCIAYKKLCNNFIIKCIRKFLPFFYYPFATRIEVNRIKNILSYNKIKPDVIHFHDLGFTSIALKLKKKLNCKLIFDSHEFFFSYPFNYGLSRKSCRNSSNALLKWKKAIIGADFAIGCTNTMDNLISLIRQDENHGIIYNSSMFEMNTEKRSIKQGRKIVLLHEGSMPFNRGLKLMLEIFRDDYIRENFQLRIVGNVKGAEKQYFEDKCREYNLTEENIYFTGWLDYLDVPKALQGDIGILFFEKAFNAFYSMPNKLFNYQVVGVPVLSTHCADLSDIINKFNTGIVVERNIESVKQGLKKLCEHYEYYQNNVLENQKKFHWSTDEKQLFEIYRKVLGQ